VIELKGVNKSFNGQEALNNISINIEAGKTLVLLGTSGCGKSTILKHLNGILEPDSGQVLYQGKPLNSLNIEELRRKFGYVIQDGGLFPHLSAKENVAIVARFLKWDSERIDARISELASMVQLDPELMTSYPLQLSGGERQRVGLMRALMLNPEVLLLDEPLGALDPITRNDLQSDLKKIFQNLKKTVVIVTHDLNEAAYLADDIVVLSSGRIVQQGSMDDLLQRPADEFVAKFVNAQRNLI
jgi:osmoprotectant transport system ATP-binding protein